MSGFRNSDKLQQSKERYTMSYDVNILVNGKRCKTYSHGGVLYLEGKAGSEYEIEIKNNSNSRVDAVASVDGLSVMTGKPANDSEGGYVIDAYSSYKIKGIRYSNDSVGGFRFNYKDRSYAASKGDGSEVNCGVIACKIFPEKIAYTTHIKKTYKPRTVWDEMWYFDNTHYATCTDDTPTSFGSGPSTGGLYGEARHGYSTTVVSGAYNPYSVKSMNCSTETHFCKSVTDNESTNEVFNLGTEWGSAIESKVVSTNFIRDGGWTTFEYYYTDRNGLIALGIPLDSFAKINLPESFPGNYATPPKNWDPQRNRKH